MKRRILSVLLCFVMVLGMMPTMAFATDDGATTTPKTIMLGTGGILNPSTDNTPNSYIYFGVNSKNSDAPIQWRVLDANAASNGTSGGMFLLSEYLLASGVVFNDTGSSNNGTSSSNTYQGSRAQEWCTTFANSTSNFSTQEQNAMLSTTKTESGNITYSGHSYSYEFGSCNLSGDKLFFLSAKELANYVCNKSEDGKLQAAPLGDENKQNWWLRSPHASTAGLVWASGAVRGDAALNEGNYARPAFNMDTSKILFTSAAEGGKSISGMDSRLTAVTDYSGNKWKLTLKDTSRQFSVNETTANGKSGGTVTLNYTRATVGTNEYISAMLTDNSGVTYYGRVMNTTAAASASGTVGITIPETLAEGKYTLKVFSEQYNGDRKTDYASAFYDVELTVKNDEAEIGQNLYQTLKAALDAASANGTADAIEILRESVTCVDTATLKANDSLVTYGSSSEYKAIDDATLSVDKTGKVTFTRGKVQIVKGTATLSNSAGAIGKSGKLIENPTSSGTDTITVTADGTDNKDTVTVPKGTNNAVTIEDITYTNGSESADMVLEVSENGVKLKSGAVKLDNSKAITGSSTQLITGKTGAITVEASGTSVSDTVTVPQAGSFTVGSGDDAKTYTAASADTKFTVNSDGTVILSSGSAALSENDAIKVALADGSVAVENTGSENKNVTVAISGTARTVAIPATGSVNIGNAAIGGDGTGVTTVYINTDGTLTVNIPNDTVTVDGKKYQGGEGTTLTVNSTSGKVTGISGYVVMNGLGENESYTLKSGQTMKIGNYKYTAPTSGNSGNITLTGRNNDTPKVTLSKANDTVDVALASDENTKTTYTAVNAKTEFAMSATDTDTKHIDLLDNGESGAEANSRIKVANGVAVTVGEQTITATVNDTIIGLLSGGTAKLYDGAGITTGTITAVIDEVDKSFSGTTKYTVNTTEKNLTLNSGSEESPASVTMSVGGKSVIFTGLANNTFALSKSSDYATVTFPAGASITVKGVTVTGVGNDTKVEIALADGALTLAEGKGSVGGEATIEVKVKDTNNTINVTVPQDKTYVIDADGGTVSGINKDETVTIGDVTYTSGEDSGSFSIAGSNAGKLTATGDSASVPANKSAIITLGNDEGAPVVAVPAATTDNSGTTVITKTNKGATVELGKANDTFKVNDKTFTAGSDGAEFTVSKEGDAVKVTLKTGSATLNAGDSITGKSGKAIVNTAGSDKAITVEAGTGNADTVTVPASGKVTINNVEYEAGANGATLVVDGTDKVTVSSGSVKLDNNESITGSSGKVIENTCADSGKTITVEAGTDNTDTVTVPDSGKVTINNVEYEAGTDGATLVVDSAGEVTVSGGSVKLDSDNGNITAGITGAVITNPTEDRILTVTSGSGKDTVTVPVGGSVEVGGTTYGNASGSEEMVIDLTKVEAVIKATITEGTATLPAGKALITKDIEVANHADSGVITVSDDGDVTVPEGGSAKIGEVAIGGDKDNKTTVNIDDGVLTVNIPENGTVTIGDKIYTGRENTTLTVDSTSGKVTGISGDVVMNGLGENESYTLKSGQTMTIGKYKYTAPTAGNSGNITLTGRDNGTPKVTLSNVNDKVDVTLASDDNTAAVTYTAANADTVLAMAANDTDTTKVELFDRSGNANSAVKFTDKGVYTVNGVTYQAQTVKNADEATAYTVTYGKVANEDGIVSNRNTVSVESGSKVIATMNSGDSIQVNDKPFTATNNSASIIIDSSVESTLNNVSGNGSYLTEIKGEDGTVTGYKVTRYSGGSSTTPTTDEVTNTTEDKKTDTSTGTETTTVEKTIATVKNTTETAADGTKTVAATVSTATAEKIVENAVSKKSEEVVVKATTAAAVTETAAGTTTKVDLPEQAVKAIAEKTDAAVTIKTEAAEVTLDKEAVKAVAEQAGDTGTVNLVVETVKQDESAVKVDLKLVTSNGNVTSFKGGSVAVTVKLNNKLAAKEVKCVYIDDNERYQRVEGSKGADGTFTFKTGHFSTYAIMAADEADKVIADQLDTLIKEVSLKVKTTKTSKKNIKVTVSGNVTALTDAGYTVKYRFCRSTKASSSYVGKKTKDTASWTNTAGKKGTKYYYKAKVYVYDENGTKVGQTTLSQSKYSSRTWSKK